MSEVKEVNATVKGQQDDKVMAAVATIPVVGLIIFYAVKDASPLVKNYAKQSNAVLAMELVLIVLSVIISILTMALSGVLGAVIGLVTSCVTFIVFLLPTVAWILLLIKALQGEMYKLPVIGDFFDKLLK